MAKPTSQWACIVILALLTMAHAVRLPHRPARSRKLLMAKNGEPETNFQASDPDDKAAQQHHSQMDNAEAISSSCVISWDDKGIYGGGHGSGSTSIKFPNIFPFSVFPFGGLVPQITTWGEGGGYGVAGKKPGCQCTHGQFPMHYVITPVYFQPIDSEDGRSEMAPGPSDN